MNINNYLQKSKVRCYTRFYEKAEREEDSGEM